MKDVTLSAVHDILLRNYLSFEEPNFKFESDNEQEDVISQVAKDIGNLHSYEITSDANYDISTILSVSSGSKNVIVHLSFLDRLVFIDFISEDAMSAHISESIEIILDIYEYMNVSELVLAAKSPIKLALAEEKSTIFNALFSDQYDMN